MFNDLDSNSLLTKRLVNRYFGKYRSEFRKIGLRVNPQTNDSKFLLPDAILT